MSLILDALKRAERERKTTGSPILGQAAAADSPAAPRRHWRLGGIALLVLIAGLLLWTGLRQAPQTPPETVSTAAPAAVLPAPPPAPSVIPGTEAVASLDDLTDEPLEEEPGSTPVITESTPAPAITRPESQTSAPPTQPLPPDTADEPAADVAEPVEPRSAPPIPPALSQPAPLRKLREMPPDYRADFPALTIEVHVYEREVARRMVMINGRRYREGERLAEGPQVLEIVREGLVFEHRGERVLYPLGR